MRGRRFSFAPVDEQTGACCDELLGAGSSNVPLTHDASNEVIIVTDALSSACLGALKLDGSARADSIAVRIVACTSLFAGCERATAASES